MLRLLSAYLTLLFLLPAFAHSNEQSLVERCAAALAGTAKDHPDTISKARRGSAVHDPGRKFWPLTAEQYDELDLKPVTEILQKNAQTAYGRNAMQWMLQNPRTDVREIREVQAAVKELHNNPALHKRVIDALSGVRKFETNQLWGDRVRQAIKRAFGSHELPEDRNIDLRVDLLTKEVSDSSRASEITFIAMALMPIGLGTIGLLADNPKTLALATAPSTLTSAISISTSMNGRSRTLLRGFTFYAKALRKLAPALKAAQSSYLRELGELIDLFGDPKRSIGVSRLMRGMSTMTTSALIAGAIDSALISTAYIPLYKKQTIQNLHRVMTLISAVSEIDALQGFSRLYENPTFTTPTILDESLPVQIHLKNAHHPLLVLKNQNSVPNSAALAKDSDARLFFLTGGNDRGKTTYIRSIALASTFAQVGLPVAAESAALTPIAIISTIRKSDSTNAGLSSFRAEARRVGDLLNKFSETPRSLLILDESFTGTDTNSRDVAERALVSYLSRHGALALIASHNRRLTELEGVLPGFRNLHGSDDLETKYQVLPGASRQRNALDVLAEEGLPEELLEEARRNNTGQ